MKKPALFSLALLSVAILGGCAHEQPTPSQTVTTTTESAPVGPAPAAGTSTTTVVEHTPGS